ncbi:LytR/AlgR family response regulator transcription factor [Streptococcus ictaluri]|uniref:Sensory transduction protein LytT n=1 Tax=Streptococcus ictaluri 707-05 TaxID=764299 RepID=G5K584_9STRE|nr:LytTR family transcriptional regulator DNA-binding domain-containing protein [Streptococcus ictaluri]EHI69057.1 sensory transduction protein LytT [Streptococcus ictaluri 707-05]
MKVVIIDDEPLARMELAFLLEQTQQVESIFQGESIEDALQLILTQQPDLLFLDIHLTDESGLDLAKTVSSVSNPPLIIFATAYDNHAVEAFEVNALDYILKPFEGSRIQKAIEKAQLALTNKQSSSSKESLQQKERLTIEVDERIYLLPFSEIVYCEVQGKETTVYTAKKQYTSHISLGAIEKQLKASRFLKVHRSYLINLDEIKEIQPWFNQTYQVTMSNGGKVPVSRSYLKQFKEQVGL